MRELFAALESAALYADEGRIEAQHLPSDVRAALDGDERRYRADPSSDDERASIEAALAHAGGIVSHAAELLGMGRTTLWRKMRLFGLAAGAGMDESTGATSGMGEETS